MFSCVGLDCEIRAHFFVLGMPHTDFTVNGLGLTQITQISLNFSFDGVKSHGGSPPPRSVWLTQISQIPLIFFDGVKSHRCSPSPRS